MSQNIRATPCSAGRQGRIANVLGSGIAIMSDSSIGLKPVIEGDSRGGGGCGGSARSGRGCRPGASPAALGQGGVGPTALAGSNAAYGLTSRSVDTASAEVVVRHLTDGKVLHSAPAFSRIT